ncbi:MAG: LysR substrate-binding domain-containing protein [Pseudomonadota bacterium]
MKLNQLRDFLAVAERRSIRAAARQLNLPQPNITRSIHELERELGVVLFERRAQGVDLTPMGEVFLRRARSVRRELERAQEELDQLRGETHGHLTVCMSSVPYIALFPEALPAFRKRYPLVKLALFDGVFPRVETSVKDGTIDCYIGPPPEIVPPDMLVEKLFDNTLVVMGRKGHPLAHARSLRELTGAEWMTTSITRKAEEELAPLFEQHGLPTPQLAVQAQSAMSCMITLAHSDLLIAAPVQWLGSGMCDALQIIPVVEIITAPPICIVRRAGLPLTPAADYFCDMMRRASLHMEAAAA